MRLTREEYDAFLMTMKLTGETHCADSFEKMCMVRHPTDSPCSPDSYLRWICTREKGHTGPHIAHTNPPKPYGILSIWEDDDKHVAISSSEVKDEPNGQSSR